jgi:uncharacterized membrane protein YhaH (DUF805 family)
MELVRRLGLLGRTSRSTLFGFLVASALLWLAIWFVLLGRVRPTTDPSVAAASLHWLRALQLALDLIFLWLAVRRFHDQDRPGWIALIPTALGAAMAAGLPIPGSVALLLVLATLVGLFLPGTIGPNRYGPDPRGWKSREHYNEQQQHGGAAREPTQPAAHS